MTRLPKIAKAFSARAIVLAITTPREDVDAVDRHYPGPVDIGGPVIFVVSAQADPRVVASVFDEALDVAQRESG